MYIDTSCLLRYMLRDIPEQSQKAAEVIIGGAEIYPETVPEAVCVFQKIYRIGRKEIASALIDVLDDIGVERKDQIREALALFGETRLDYVDCLLLAGFLSSKNDFATFDRKLQSRKKALADNEKR